ncbi:MAG: hypothetical protein HN927_03745 [Candidatus Marinimicrobia bacterium]|jgi:hypothetical protein|nr:hypothetical protein [Candidatus Neomarinimicrobiota bacterium]MBT3937815.1 hypothetical protein [Candidatus Neomarinimicrobiota bacterium]MBT4064845.1 hypothetical protein [Candidatus Neomarinimicrobiota bacterium]MBT4453686.1 hypothetical protein [Candidatus Neomarinimicrobiota bacterium]MBT4736266.1 hypothetical protein [Candidatus Neomarinimicrobiota bacterium]
MSFTLEQKFNLLSQITRASHFEWREAFIKMFPDLDPAEAVMNYWEIVGQDTARAFLKRIDRDKPVAPQIAEMIVNSSLAMGETAEMVQENDGKMRLVHGACPWYDWHKKYDALEEDQPGCDCWIQTIVKDINQELNTHVRVETLSSLPAGDENCTRIFTEK